MKRRAHIESGMLNPLHFRSLSPLTGVQLRKKLEPLDNRAATSRVEAGMELVRDVVPPDSEMASVHQSEVPPWAESYEIASTEMDGQ